MPIASSMAPEYNFRLSPSYLLYTIQEGKGGGGEGMAVQGDWAVGVTPPWRAAMKMAGVSRELVLEGPLLFPADDQEKGQGRRKATTCTSAVTRTSLIFLAIRGFKEPFLWSHNGICWHAFCHAPNALISCMCHSHVQSLVLGTFDCSCHICQSLYM